MREVEHTAELQRILALPRREPVISDELIDALSALLRTPHGTQRLLPLQALALHDIGIMGGGFMPLDVGEGKTLVSLLAAHVLRARRPLLLLRAHLIGKTKKERNEYVRDWLIPNHICLMSYQMLGLVQSATWLEEIYKPDLIIADEVQGLKNRDAAVTRRVERYLDRHPTTCFVGMTGTIMRTSIRDFAHSLRWALKDKAPVPATDAEVDEWAFALDDKLDDEFTRVQPGALLNLATPEEREGLEPLTAARRGFRARLRETPGVICSASTGTKVDASLRIRALQYDLSSTTVEHFKSLRNDKKTPDGFDIWEAAEVWRHARELALGFHQVWQPQPPDEWKEPRRVWYAFVREVLSRSETLDSPGHVETACDAAATGRLRMTATLERGIDLLGKWRAVKDTFTPNPVPVWHDDSALHAAARWMQQGPGIVWVEHVPFGQRLAQLTGASYFGAEGFSSSGEFIDNADASGCVIASVKANREGRNLQLKWWRNLVTTPAEGADLWQQLVGRTHRPKQRAPEVLVDVFLGCAEHARAWSKAMAGAVSILDTVGSQSKLLIAKIEWPGDMEIASWTGSRWK